ncbi:MAG: guanylate kinase, partial [Candidatus Krumholzibacteria bacterium]|nr:guanylate kinase [Candidatus Krumholzibacteria bacterium]
MGAINVSRTPFIVVVSGPSGVGKSTIVARLLEVEKKLCGSISLTTRPARGKEAEGDDYHFVTRD